MKIEIDRTVLQQALDALVACADYIPCNTVSGERNGDMAESATIALREVLAAANPPNSRELKRSQHSKTPPHIWTKRSTAHTRQKSLMEVMRMA